MQRALAESERAFTWYDAVVDAATDEQVMLEAQRLSESALARIAVLRREP